MPKSRKRTIVPQDVDDNDLQLQKPEKRQKMLLIKNPMLIDVVVDRVLSFVEGVEDLKSTSLVCNLWRKEGQKYLFGPKSNVTLALKTTDDQSDDNDGNGKRGRSSGSASKKRKSIETWESDVETYLTRVKDMSFSIQHLAFENKDRMALDNYQKHCLRVLTVVGHRLKSLEISLMSAIVGKDMNFFKAVLQKAPGLEELCINYNVWNTKGRVADIQDLHFDPYPSLKTLKVNASLKHFTEMGPPNQMDGARRFFSDGDVFGDISSFFLLTMCQHGKYAGNFVAPFSKLENLSVCVDKSSNGSDSMVQSFTVDPIDVIKRANPHMGQSTLKSIHLSPGESFVVGNVARMSKLTKLVIEYPKSIRHYDLLFSNHAPTLQELEFKFRLPTINNLELLRVPAFPKLEKLTYTLDMRKHIIVPTMGYHDILDLEGLFKAVENNRFSTIFPVLKELNLNLGRWAFYKKVLPRPVVGNPTFPQIKTVKATLEVLEIFDKEGRLRDRLHFYFPSAEIQLTFVPNSSVVIF